MTQAERSRRYRLRKDLAATALMSNILPVEAAFLGRKSDGTYVLIDYDKVATLLEPIEGTTQRRVTTTQPRSLYSPKGVTKEVYDAWCARVRGADLPRTKLVTKLRETTEASKGDTRKLNARLLALVEALPDTPDYLDHLPAWSAS